MAPRTPKKPTLTHFVCVPLVTTASNAARWRASLELLAAEATDPASASATTACATTTTTNAITSGGGHGSGDDGVAAAVTTATAATAAGGPAEPPITVAAAAVPVPSPLPPKAIRPLHSIHLTLGVMSLRDQAKVAEAARALAELDVKDVLRRVTAAAAVASTAATGTGTEECAVGEVEDPKSYPDHSPASPPPPLHLRLTGLHAMQSPQRTSVLYAAPIEATASNNSPSASSTEVGAPSSNPSSSSSSGSGSDRLLRFCTAVRDGLAARELLVPDDRPLRLHATVINTLYARKDGLGSGKRGGRDRRARKLPEGWGRPSGRARGKEAEAEVTGGKGTAMVGSGEGRGGGEEEGEEAAAGGERRDVEAIDQGDGPDPRSHPNALDKDGKIDARWLMERWKDRVWAEVTVDRVAICEMGAKPDENGEVRYKEIAVAEL